MTTPNPDPFEQAVSATHQPAPEAPPRNTHGGARPGAGRPKGSKNRNRSAAPNKQPLPPVPELTPELKRYYSAMLRRLDGMVLGDVEPKIEPLTPEEADAGAEALHPLIAIYGGLFLDPRVQFALWAGSVYVPRTIKFLRDKRDGDAPSNEPVREEPAATFSRETLPPNARGRQAVQSDVVIPSAPAPRNSRAA